MTEPDDDEAHFVTAFLDWVASHIASYDDPRATIEGVLAGRLFIVVRSDGAYSVVNPDYDIHAALDEATP